MDGSCRRGQLGLRPVSWPREHAHELTIDVKTGRVSAGADWKLPFTPDSTAGWTGSARMDRSQMTVYEGLMSECQTGRLVKLTVSACRRLQRPG